MTAVSPKTVAALGLSPQDLSDLRELGVQPNVLADEALIARLGDEMNLLSDDASNRINASAYGFEIEHQPHPSARGPKRHRVPAAPAMA